MLVFAILLVLSIIAIVAMTVFTPSLTAEIYISTTYLYVLASLLSIVLISSFKMKNSAMVLLAIPLMFVFVVLIDNFSSDQILSHLFLVGLIACMGVLMSPIINNYIKRGIFLPTALTMLVMFAVCTAIAFTGVINAKGFSPYVFASILGLIVFGLFEIFFKMGTIYTISLSAVSIIVFNIILVYDTQMLSESASQKIAEGCTNPRDPCTNYPSAMLNIFLDLINLFLNTGQIGSYLNE